MSIVECKSSFLKSFPEFIDDKQWKAYLKAIDDEIEFLIEWEKNVENRQNK